jgi:hypothetical protein
MSRSLTALVLSALVVSAAFASVPDPPLPNKLDDLAQRMLLRREELMERQEMLRQQMLQQEQMSREELLRVQAQFVPAAVGQPAAQPARAPAAPAPAPVTSPAASPATQPDPTQWAALLAQLTNDDFAIREAGQRELNKIGYRQLDFLRRAAETATDLEIKGRLATRVNAIEEDLATNPPPISVELKDATIADVADEVSRALGIKFDTYPPRNQGLNLNDTYTLSATDRPFWEVFLDLTHQHNLGFYNNGNQTMLSGQMGQSYASGSANGPLLILPTNLNRQRSINFQNPNGPIASSETMYFNCTLMLDPRIRLVKYAQPQFTEVVDDLGNILFNQPANMQPTNEIVGGSRIAFQMSMGTSLKVPEPRGTKIASAKGVFRAVIQTADEHLDVSDIEKKIGQSFDFGGYTMRLRSFQITSDNPNSPINVNLYINTENSGARVMLPGGGVSQPPIINLSLIDATGKVVYSTTTRGGTSLSTSGNMTLPLTMRLSAPSKTKEITIPFELKDLPLP